MDFRSFLKDNTVILDGGMGTLLQKKGVLSTGHPEELNITHPEIITGIHRDYFDAGSNVVCTNTFGANILKFERDTLEKIISAAVQNAVSARAESSSTHPKFVALDIGPTGRLLAPMGRLDFEDAVSVFAESIRIGAKCGVDLIVIETMNDSYETKAALLAAKENSSLPVIVTNAYGADGCLLTGASPAAMVALLEGMGVDALGANCSRSETACPRCGRAVKVRLRSRGHKAKRRSSLGGGGKHGVRRHGGGFCVLSVSSR